MKMPRATMMKIANMLELLSPQCGHGETNNAPREAEGDDK